LRDRQGAPDLFEGFYRLEELKLVRITPQLGASHETVGIVYPTPELIWLLVWAQVPTVSD
jgi:hypothetical protein